MSLILVDTTQHRHVHTGARGNAERRIRIMALLWILMIELSVFQTTFAKSIRSNAVLDMSGEIASRNSFTAAGMENNGILEDEKSFLELQTQAQASFGGFGVSVVKFMTGSNSVCRLPIICIYIYIPECVNCKGISSQAEYL